MSQIKLGTVESKTSTKGTNYKKVSLIAEGREYPEVAVFSFFPKYNEVVAGATVEGVIQAKEYNGKQSYSLVSGNLGNNPYPRQSSSIASAVKEKAQNIEKAQERKSDAIMTSSTMRDAVQIAIAETTNPLYPVANIDNRIKFWRKWLCERWNDPENYPPFP